MLLILTIIRFTVFGLVKRWFKSWVAVDLMDVLNHFQQYFTHVVVRAYWRVQSKNLDKLDHIKLYIEFTSYVCESNSQLKW